MKIPICNLSGLITIRQFLFKPLYLRCLHPGAFKEAIGDFFLVVGPEGGFAKEEIELAESMDFTSVSLGRQILKVETAALAILSIIQYEIGAFGRLSQKERRYYRCVEDYFETFVQIYDEHFSRQYGFWRPYVEQVIYRYLDCGDLHNGFARVKCKDCGHEYLLAFSCKRRHFCPSCHQKRVVEFGEWLCRDVLKKIPHRHFVFSIPKILRRYFLGACPVLDTGTGNSLPISAVAPGNP